MPRPLLCIVALLGLSMSSLGQAGSPASAQSSPPDTHTMQALLSEVRALRQELRVVLTRAQNIQLLLARFQIQEGVVARVGDRLNQARQQSLDAQIHQKELALEQKRLEDSLPAPDPQQQSDVLDRLSHVKSDLEVATRQAKQRQSAETEAGQQFQEEQDKLNTLENQLDELTVQLDNANGKPGADRP